MKNLAVTPDQDFEGCHRQLLLETLNMMKEDPCAQLSVPLMNNITTLHDAVTRNEHYGNLGICKLVQCIKKPIENLEGKHSTVNIEKMCSKMYCDLIGNELQSTFKDFLADFGVKFDDVHAFLWLFYESLRKLLLKNTFPTENTETDISENERTPEMTDSELQTLRYVGGFIVHKLRRRQAPLAQGVAKALTESETSEVSTSNEVEEKMLML